MIKTKRRCLTIKTGKATAETVYHLASEIHTSKTPEHWANTVRAHWGIESKNHWRRDACVFEDKTRSKNPNLVATLAILRCPLLLFNSWTSTQNLNAFIEHNAANRNQAFALVMNKK